MTIEEMIAGPSPSCVLPIFISPSIDLGGFVDTTASARVRLFDTRQFQNNGRKPSIHGSQPSDGFNPAMIRTDINSR